MPRNSITMESRPSFSSRLWCYTAFLQVSLYYYCRPIYLYTQRRKVGIMSRWENVGWENVVLGKYRLGKCRIEKMSIGNLSSWEIVPLRTCRIGNMSHWETVVWETVVGKMSFGKMSRWETVGWETVGKPFKIRNDKTASSTRIFQYGTPSLYHSTLCL